MRHFELVCFGLLKFQILNDYGTPNGFGLVDNSSLIVNYLSINPCAIAGVRC